MFKVLIIDDEPITRKGLKNTINWKQFDCEICGEASDGIEGGEAVRNILPDIIITDIKMPEVDGLAMIRQIRDVVPDCKIIILTAYRDFDYIHEAMTLGVFSYVLKPSKIGELTSIIKKAVKELRFQKDKEEEMGKFRTLFEQNIPILREKLLYDIIHGFNANVEEINDKMELFGLKIDKFSLVVVENEGVIQELQNGSSNSSQYDAHLYQFGIINSFDEIFSDTFEVTNITLNNTRIAFLVQSLEDTNESLDELVQDKCSYLQKMIENCFGFTVTIAISSYGKGPMQLSAKLKECFEALEHKFYMGPNTLISFKDLRSFFKGEDYSILENYQKALLDGIRSGNEELVKSRLDEMYSYINEVGGTNHEYLRNFYWSTVSQVNNIRVSISSADNDKGNISRDISSLYKMIEKSESISELNSLIGDISISVALKVNNYNNKSIKLILKKAVDYLQNHYMDQITLNEVAEYTYVSTYYISRMFKRELGKNFVDFLNVIRVEKAKELLRDVRLKTYEVAERVGIPDAQYFSKLFRKYTGLTPTEYRETPED